MEILVVLVFVFAVIIYVRHEPLGKNVENLAFQDYVRSILSDQRARGLCTQRRTCNIANIYGDVDPSKWLLVRKNFLDTYVRPNVNNNILSPLDWRWAIDEIDRRCDEFEINRVSFDMSNVFSGVDYEYAIAASLTDLGWVTRVTQSSGDQGVDIVAEAGGKTVAIQSKFYTSPVGNKAVQEIAAGRIHYGATLGIVVSNAGFTRSAHELAASTGILLLSHQDLDQLGRIVGVSSALRPKRSAAKTPKQQIDYDQSHAIPRIVTDDYMTPAKGVDADQLARELAILRERLKPR